MICQAIDTMCAARALCDLSRDARIRTWNLTQFLLLALGFLFYSIESNHEYVNVSAENRSGKAPARASWYIRNFRASTGWSRRTICLDRGSRLNMGNFIFVVFGRRHQPHLESYTFEIAPKRVQMKAMGSKAILNPGVSRSQRSQGGHDNGKRIFGWHLEW